MGLYNEKGCPFCETGIASICRHHGIWYVACDDGRCEAAGPGRATRQAAIDAWNTRYDKKERD